MKTIIFTLVALFTLNSYATTDAETEVYVVKSSVHEYGEYSLQKVPATFCVGMMTQGLAKALIQPVTIKSNYGCGNSMVYDYQMNEMTCALISTSNENYPDHHSSNWALQTTVDVHVTLSGCGERAKEESFVRAVTEAVYKTFNENGIQINNFKQD